MMVRPSEGHSVEELGLPASNGSAQGAADDPSGGHSMPRGKREQANQIILLRREATGGALGSPTVVKTGKFHPGAWHIAPRLAPASRNPFSRP